MEENKYEVKLKRVVRSIRYVIARDVENISVESEIGIVLQILPQSSDDDDDAKSTIIQSEILYNCKNPNWMIGEDRLPVCFQLRILKVEKKIPIKRLGFLFVNQAPIVYKTKFNCIEFSSCLNFI